MLIDQACERLCVSKRTIYYWIRAGRLQTIRTLGGSQRVLVSSLDDWVRARPVQPALLGRPRREAAIHQ